MLRATEPALAAELDAYEAGIVEPGGSPVMPEEGKCVWYDSGEAGSEAESGFCKHWKERPEACENFELGGERCVSLRKLLSVDDVGVPWRRKMAAAGEEIP